MNKKFLTVFFLISCTVSFIAVYAAGETYKFFIVNPGGFSAGEQGEKIINQFVDTVAGLSGISKNSMSGTYYPDISGAASRIKPGENIFVMGSLGFFLSYRESRRLKPLAVMNFENDSNEQFYVIVKKGKYKKLEDLKGGKVSGSVFFENDAFIDRIVFGGKIKHKNFFKADRTARVFSSVKKLSKGQMDAVLLNKMQYESLKGMPVFVEFELIYSSGVFPAVCLMMSDTRGNAAVSDRIVDTVSKMCTLDEGREVCRNFGIRGFKKADEAELSEAYKMYSGN